MFSQPENSSAVTAPLDRRQEGGAAPKRDRRRRLTKIDRRSRLGLRIDELKALYESAFPAGELTPLRRERIGEAAQLKAMAEAERGAWMRGEAKCDLDELIRLERRAVQAVRALGLSEAAKPAPSLLSQLAEGAR